MNNLYFIETDNFELINLKTNDILKKHKLTTNNLITYDMDEVNISDAIIDLDTYSFFNECKVVLCKNANFLTTSKCEINHDLVILEKYLNNPHPSNILILSSSKTDGKKNIVKLVKQKCEIIDVDIDLLEYIKNKVSDYKVSDSVIRYFLEYTGDDLIRIDNELDKILALKIKEKEITKNDIDLIVTKKIDASIYDLIDAIISKNKERSLRIYQEMTSYGEDIFKIFVTLSNQIRLIYQVKVLRNLNNDEICQKLKLKNVKQVVALRYKIDKYSSEELLSYLHKLSIMDEELKTGKCIDQIVFPLFIASL